MIKTRWEAAFVIYALALGACDRGLNFVAQYPGWFGWSLFFAGTSVIFMAGARLMETTRRDNRERRRKDDLGTTSQILA